MSNLTQGGEARELLAIEYDKISEELGYDCPAGFEAHNRALLIRAGLAEKPALRAIETALTLKSTEEDRLREALLTGLNRTVPPEHWDGTWEQAIAYAQNTVDDVFRARLALSPEGEEGLDG